MATSKLSTIYAVDINATLIDHVVSMRVDPAIAQEVRGADGLVQQSFVAIMSQSPVVETTSLALKKVLDAMGLMGTVLPGPVTFAFQAITQGGQRTAGSTHIDLTVNEGMLVLQSISASQGQIAQVVFQTVASYDGSNEPIVIAGSQALIGSPAVTEVFTVGPANINGVLLEGIQSIDVQFGIEIISMMSAGDIWPTFLATGQIKPIITIRTTDPDALLDIGLDGTAQGVTDSVVYFRKKAIDGTNVTDETAEHISMTIDQGQITVSSVQGDHPNPIETEIIITPTFDGTNASIVFATAVAIT
jgi:hypothetical protein